ncbi:MAG TPA: YraN family protein [Patescibacteria group bacterium]
MNTRSVGNSGEEAAVLFIEQLGWQVVGRNLHYRFGEIDILATNGTHMIVIEVKAKKSSMYGEAVEMVTRSKQATLRKLAKVVEAEYNKPVRIDVITLDNFATSQASVTHYPFAIGE